MKSSKLQRIPQKDKDSAQISPTQIDFILKSGVRIIKTSSKPQLEVPKTFSLTVKRVTS